MSPSDENIAALARSIGIDAQEIVRRKAFLEFDETDVGLLTELHARLQDVSQHFVNDFYTHLIKFDETRRFIPDAPSLERLKQTQAAYFDSLTAGDYGPEYILNRLRVGIVHQHIGLEPKWYIGAYSRYLVGLLPELWRLLGDDPDKFLATHHALQKIAFLDMGLALDTYMQVDRHTILGLKRYAENIIASLPAGMLVVNDTLKVRSVNRSFREMFGLKNGEDISGRELEDLLPLPDLRQQAQAVLAGGMALRSLEAALGEKWLRLTITGIRLAEEEEEEEEEEDLLVVVEDITELKRANDTLRVAAATFEAQEAIVITDPDSKILRVNQAFERLSGYRAEELIGQNPRILKSGRHDAAFYQAMWSDLLSTGKWSGEVWDKRKNGEIYPKYMTITAVYDDHHQVTHYVAVSSDISERKQAEADIHQLAFYDPLTKLPNRRLLLDRLQQAMAGSVRSGRYGALLFLDLDHFKTINDTQGHAMGDLLLIEVARRLQTCVREGDSVARLGGDEFVVVLEELSSEPGEAATQTELVAEKIRNELDQPYALKNYECHTTPSIGISLFRGHLESVEDLLKHADIAMYQAKTSGRNTLRFFDPDMQAALEARATLEADLRHALSQQQFKLFFQIQVNAVNHPIGAEALLRWLHPERGLVSPLQFIPLAEDTGLILPIGQWVLETACAQIRAWETNPLARELQLAVNVSARQFHQPDFVEQIRATLKKTGADPARLKLELTESVVLGNIDNAVAKMHELKGIGVHFSMDDFGTGYSSLSYLTQLPLDQLKIDQSFVRNIGTKPTDAVIVQTIIGMGNSLGMQVIAEGVENAEQREFLERHGCHAYQGYLFSKPIPVKEFEKLIAQYA